MKKNLYLYITISVLLVFTVVYFVAANKISYAFEYSEKDAQYENIILQIETVSKYYASNNLDLFKDENTIYITVNDLVTSGIFPSENGKVNDPRSDVLTLNDVKLRITKNNDTFDVKVLS